MSERDIMKGLDSYIEFANETKRFSDAGFYEAVKEKLSAANAEIELLKGGWISVADRLPEEGRLCQWAYKYSQDDPWLYEEASPYDGQETVDICYWMLVSPPKKEV